MSNDLIVSTDSGAAAGGPATGYTPAGEWSGGASRTPSAGRRREIEAVMRTDIESYFAQGLDRELAAILAGDVANADPDAVKATVPMHWRDSRRELQATHDGAALVHEWDSKGGFSVHLQAVQDRAAKIVQAVGDNRAQRLFMQRFDNAFPDHVRFALYDEMTNGLPGYVRPVDDAGLKRFAANPVGADLVKEWGSDAPTRVAIAWQRVERIKSALGEDADEFFAWFETLKPAHAKAIMQVMTR